jgi:hypothetical protein
MITTEKTTVMVPKTMIAKARETFPQTADMSTARILRFALAYALTEGNTESAIAATQDARIGTKRTTKIE